MLKRPVVTLATASVARNRAEFTGGRVENGPQWCDAAYRCYDGVTWEFSRASKMAGLLDGTHSVLVADQNQSRSTMRPL